MIYIIIIAVIAFFFYLSAKGNADIKNVEKYGGLKYKYKTLIDLIMSRNSFYQLREINTNNIELTNTGMTFKLIEMDKKLQITWTWNSFGSGQNHKLLWKFDENEDQTKMYQKLDKDMAVQNLVDDGMNKQQAEDFYVISKTSDENEQNRLTEIFSKKYPELWSKITGE
jgi:hypothetical protein